MEILQKIILVITIIGALNWATIGLFDYNLITSIFGGTSSITRFIYILFGISAIFNMRLLFTKFDYD